MMHKASKIGMEALGGFLKLFSSVIAALVIPLIASGPTSWIMFSCYAGAASAFGFFIVEFLLARIF